MKRYWIKSLILFLSFGFSQLLVAQDADLENLLFNMTIKDLNNMSTSELDDLSENGEWLLLDGSLAALTRLSAKEEEYLLDAQLIQGEWLGLEEVKKYGCHLIFQGDKWLEIVPDKTPRRPKEGQILLNSRILVLASVLGYEMVENRVEPYLLVDKIRLLP